MLRESSTRTPRKFCCGTAAFSTSVGRKRQRRSTASAATRRPIRMTRSRRRSAADTPRYVRSATSASAIPAMTMSRTGRDRLQLKSPCWNMRGGYLKRKRNSRSTTRSVYREPTHGGAALLLFSRLDLGRPRPWFVLRTVARIEPRLQLAVGDRGDFRQNQSADDRLAEPWARPLGNRTHEVVVDVAVSLGHGRPQRAGRDALFPVTLGYGADLLFLAGHSLARFFPIRGRMFDFGIQLGAHQHGERRQLTPEHQDDA